MASKIIIHAPCNPSPKVNRELSWKIADLHYGGSDGKQPHKDGSSQDVHGGGMAKKYDTKGFADARDEHKSKSASNKKKIHKAMTSFFVDNSLESSGSQTMSEDDLSSWLAEQIPSWGHSDNLSYEDAVLDYSDMIASWKNSRLNPKDIAKEIDRLLKLRGDFVY